MYKGVCVSSSAVVAPSAAQLSRLARQRHIAPSAQSGHLSLERFDPLVFLRECSHGFFVPIANTHRYAADLAPESARGDLN